MKGLKNIFCCGTPSENTENKSETRRPQGPTDQINDYVQEPHYINLDQSSDGKTQPISQNSLLKGHSSNSFEDLFQKNHKFFKDTRKIISVFYNPADIHNEHIFSMMGINHFRKDQYKDLLEIFYYQSENLTVILNQIPHSQQNVYDKQVKMNADLSLNFSHMAILIFKPEQKSPEKMQKLSGFLNQIQQYPTVKEILVIHDISQGKNKKKYQDNIGKKTHDYHEQQQFKTEICHVFYDSSKSFHNQVNVRETLFGPLKDKFQKIDFSQSVSEKIQQIKEKDCKYLEYFDLFGAKLEKYQNLAKKYQLVIKNPHLSEENKELDVENQQQHFKSNFNMVLKEGQSFQGWQRLKHGCIEGKSFVKIEIKDENQRDVVVGEYLDGKMGISHIKIRQGEDEKWEQLFQLAEMS